MELFLPAIVSGLLALFSARELVIARQYVANRVLRILLAVVLFTLLDGVMLFLFSFFQVALCGVGGACGWIAVGYMMLSFVAIPVGIVVSIIVCMYWMKQSTAAGASMPSAKRFRFIATTITGLVISASIAGSWWFYRDATAPQRAYENVQNNLDSAGLSSDFGELYTFNTGEKSSTAPHDFLAEDIDGDGKKEIIYLIYNGAPRGPNNSISQLYLAVSTADGTPVRNCFVRSELVQRGALTIAGIGSTAKAVVIAGATTDDIPFISVIDPTSCSKLSQVDFAEGAQAPVRGGDIRVNGSSISFFAYGERCQYELSAPQSSAICVDEA